MQARSAYAACMQYTVRNIPANLDQALRQRARKEGKSLNDVALEALVVGMSLNGEPMKRRDLGDIAGSWQPDPAVDRALEDQRRIDPDLWR